MLGKIFENLIDYNHEQGAYYTPRAIVHHMCKSALFYTLDSKIIGSQDKTKALQELIQNQAYDNAFIKANATHIKECLESCRILDPAIGSGAFPMGLLNEILSLHTLLDKALGKDEPTLSKRASLKRKIIAEQIYGIDIDCDAIEIVKLRFWLSIAVDEDTPSPLPNFDFKFMQGNSLLESLFIGDRTFHILPENFGKEEKNSEKNQDGLFDERDDTDKPIFNEAREKDLQELFLSFYKATDHSQKQEIKSKILGIMRQAFDTRDKEIQKKIQNNIDNLNNPNNPNNPHLPPKIKNKTLAL